MHAVMATWVYSHAGSRAHNQSIIVSVERMLIARGLTGNRHEAMHPAHLPDHVQHIWLQFLGPVRPDAQIKFILVRAGLERLADTKDGLGEVTMVGGSDDVAIMIVGLCYTDISDHLHRGVAARRSRTG